MLASYIFKKSVQDFFMQMFYMDCTLLQMSFTKSFIINTYVCVTVMVIGQLTRPWHLDVVHLSTQLGQPEQVQCGYKVTQ